MKITDVPFTVLRFQYQIARYPLQLIEDQVAARVDPEAPGRLFYERSLGTLDATVGNLLGDDDLARRGTALVERSDALIQATKLETNAAAKEQDADETLKEKRDNAVRAQQDARENGTKRSRTPRPPPPSASAQPRRPRRNGRRTPSGKPIRWLLSGWKRSRPPSVSSRPSSGRPKKRSLQTPKPSVRTRRRSSLKQRPSGSKLTQLKPWPMSRNRVGNPGR